MEKLYARTDVESLTGLSCSQIYVLMRKGKFPEPIRIGERAVRWRESELVAYVESRPRATGEAREAA